MGSFRADRWFGALAILGGGLFIAVSSLRSGSVVMGAVLLAVLAVVGWWSWPGRAGSHVSHREATEGADAQDVIVYWRPG